MGADEALGSRGAMALAIAAGAAGLGDRQVEIQQTIERLAASWSSRSDRERAPSFHTVDESPLEVSVPLGGDEPEFRFTVEPQRAPFGHAANWAAAVETLTSLRGLAGVSLAPVEPVLPLFEPTREDAFGFAMWLGAVFRGARKPAFKIYFNASFAAERGKPWHELLEPSVGPRVLREVRAALAGHGVADVGIVSFDLLDGAESRVKLYVGHAIPGPRAGVVDLACIERLERLGAKSVPGDARRLLQAFAPEVLDAGSDVPAFVGSTLHVVAGEIDRVTTNVQFLPFGPGAPPDPHVLLERAAQTFRSFEVEASAPLRRFLDAVGEGLPDGEGCMTYLSTQRENGRSRFTVYASPRLYDARRPLATA